MGKRTNQNGALPESELTQAEIPPEDTSSQEVELTQTQTEIPPEVPPIEEHDLESNTISSNLAQDSDPPSREEEPPKAGKKRVQNLSLKGKKLMDRSQRLTPKGYVKLTALKRNGLRLSLGISWYDRSCQRQIPRYSEIFKALSPSA